MGKFKEYRSGLSTFISSEKGQRFFNFAYSIGAAIVIWGALFKILHLPGGNVLLSIGMGTEVLMFILTAFDKPAKEYKWEQVFPVLDTQNEEDRPEFGGGGGGGVSFVGGGAVVGGGAAEGSGATGGGGTVVVGGGGIVGGGGTVVMGGAVQGGLSAAAQAAAQSTPADNLVMGPDGVPSVMGTTNNYLEQMAALAAEMQHLRASTEALNNVSDTLLESYRAITENSDNITRSSQGYVEQMQDLNRNIMGLNTIYEIQLKSISSQLDAIDRVNQGIKDIRDMYERSAAQSTRYCEETEKMARYMQQLNLVYERMIHAMTINMYNPMMAQAQAPAPQSDAAPTAQPETENENTQD